MAMSSSPFHRKQAAIGLEQLASLVRAQAWRGEGVPALPPTQAAVLRMLSGQQKGLRARDISGRLGVSAASLSDTLKTLEAHGWIKRHADPDDGRAAIVRLARGGKRLAEKLHSPLRGIGSLLEGLGEADLGALLRVTQLLVREAQRQGLATGMRTCLGCRYFRPYATDRPDQPHFCAFIEQPFGDAELRADCAEQEPAEETQIAANALSLRAQHPR